MKLTTSLALAGMLLNTCSASVKADAMSELDTPWGPPLTLRAFEYPLKPNQVYRVPADPEAGFFFPYFFSVPADLVSGLPILINPNNDGKVGVSHAQREYFASILNEEMTNVFGERLGVISLSPSFPRPKLDTGSGNLYIHALTREAIVTIQPRLKRVDMQLLAMHDDLKRRLASKGIKTDDTFLLYGFSAAADFVTRFAAAHPRQVRAVVAGGLGGLPILPVSHIDGQLLTYPVGVGDFHLVIGKSFDQQRFAGIPMLLVQGSIDDNDSVPEGTEMQSRENFASDSYSFEQSQWVNDYFGTLPIARIPLVSAVYQSLEPADFAYASMLGENHSDKKIKPMAVAFFECVLSGDSFCAARIKARIENPKP